MATEPARAKHVAPGSFTGEARLAISAGASYRQAMQLAAEAAAIAISPMGTAVVTWQQLEPAITRPAQPAASGVSPSD